MYVQTDKCIPARTGLCGQHGCEHTSAQGYAHHDLEPAGSIRDSICRPYIVCGDRRSSSGRKHGQDFFAGGNDTVMLPFEDSEFCALKGYERVLTEMYGDYMQLPPVEKRKGSFGETTFFWK